MSRGSNLLLPHWAWDLRAASPFSHPEPQMAARLQGARVDAKLHAAVGEPRRVRIKRPRQQTVPTSDHGQNGVLRFPAQVSFCGGNGPPGWVLLGFSVQADCKETQRTTTSLGCILTHTQMGEASRRSSLVYWIKIVRGPHWDIPTT